MDRLGIVTEAIAFIERHLAERLDLKSIAEAVHYSKYHLHRIFSDTVGLRIHDYVLRRKLTEAAKLLVLTDMPILDICRCTALMYKISYRPAFALAGGAARTARSARRIPRSSGKARACCPGPWQAAATAEQSCRAWPSHTR